MCPIAWSICFRLACCLSIRDYWRYFIFDIWGLKTLFFYNQASLLHRFVMISSFSVTIALLLSCSDFLSFFFLRIFYSDTARNCPKIPILVLGQLYECKTTTRSESALWNVTILKTDCQIIYKILTCKYFDFIKFWIIFFSPTWIGLLKYYFFQIEFNIGIYLFYLTWHFWKKSSQVLEYRLQTLKQTKKEYNISCIIPSFPPALSRPVESPRPPNRIGLN